MQGEGWSKGVASWESSGCLQLVFPLPEPGSAQKFQCLMVGADLGLLCVSSGQHSVCGLDVRYEQREQCVVKDW